jgi:hypothetical protein
MLKLWGAYGMGKFSSRLFRVITSALDYRTFTPPLGVGKR